MNPTLKALLATGRISNLPTVWCNVLVAMLLCSGLASSGGLATTALSHALLPFLSFALASALIYVGGCFLGDAIDVEFDRKHKPDRPIPSGTLKRSNIYFAAAVMLSAGALLPSLTLSEASNPLASYLSLASLIFAVVFYSILHKRSPWFGLPLIGLCRFSLILSAGWFSATLAGHVWNPQLWVYASAVGVFTISFASVARSEASPRPINWRKSLITVLLLLPLLALVGGEPLSNESLATRLVALLVYWAWMLAAIRRIRTNKGAFVAMSLAGFCLLDACFAAAFGWVGIAVAVVLFIFALLLQRIAPAT